MEMSIHSEKTKRWRLVKGSDSEWVLAAEE
jgi:hypothetical protein